MNSRRQEATTRSKTDLLRICLTATILLGSSADLFAHRIEDALRNGPSVSKRATPFQEFSKVWRELESLREADLVNRANELWESAPEHTLRAMILRVGREVPPTLTAARRSERLAIRKAAADWIRARLEHDEAARGMWQNQVRDILADSSQTIQWCATTRALGRLEQYEFARELSGKLQAKDPRLVRAVRLALYDLYLRWFDTPADFETFWPEAHQVCQDSIFMETARARDREARATLIQILEYEPQRAVALIDDPHPSLRAAAATALGRAHNGEGAAALESLLTHAETEVDGDAFQALVEALLQSQGASPANSPELVRLRTVLQRRSEEGYADLQAPVADALRRLPWTETADGEGSVLRGVDFLVSQITKLAAPHRLTDRDVVVTSMFALESLASRAQRAGLSLDRSLAPMNAMVIGMIEDESESDVVRIAAAKLLPLVGDTESIRRAATTLSARRSSPELRYNLISALGNMALELPPEDPTSKLVLATLLERLEGDDANLRRRALSYLGNEKLRPVVASADPSAFIVSLQRETVPNLQSKLLELLALRGGPQQLEALIALPNFDQIASSGPAGISSLTQTMEKLAGDDAAARVRGVARLLAVEHPATRILRLREALAVVARITDESLPELSSEQNHEIVSWASELRSAAGSLPGGEAFLGRLNRHHLPACLTNGEGRDAGQLAHVQALLLSDWIALDPEAGKAEEVLAHFDRALAYTAESGSAGARALVLRDRARFQLARGEAGPALEDYRALFDSELPAVASEAGSPETRTSVLELRDLRQGSELLVKSLATSTDKAGILEEALRVSLVLVQEANWTLEPAAVRVEDLKQLAERAIGVGDEPSITGVFTLFEDLPPVPQAPAEGQPAPALPVAPEGALRNGLLDGVGSHAALVEQRVSLNSALMVLRAAEAPAPESDSLSESTPDQPPPAEDQELETPGESTPTNGEPDPSKPNTPKKEGPQG